ncbi:AAA family ATPase [Kitasatospora sp. NPDC054939]
MNTVSARRRPPETAVRSAPRADAGPPPAEPCPYGTSCTHDGPFAAAPAASGPDGRPYLEERRPHLERITERAERARAGHGSVLVVTGATGTGRSALLAEAAHREAAHGSTVLRARCSADEAAIPYAAARQLFETGPDDHERSSADHDAADPGTAPGPDPAQALWALLRRRAARGPLLLAVDDVHHADEASRAWLLQVGRRIDRLPVLLLATERRQYGPEHTDPRFGRDLPPALVTGCRLGPLGPGAATRLVHRYTAARPGSGEPVERPGGGWPGVDQPGVDRPGPGRRFGDALAADCVRATGGNPLLLTALLADLAAHPLPADATALPDSRSRHRGEAFPEAVEHWLRGGGEASLAAARTLAELHRHPAARTRDGAPADREASGHPAPCHADPAAMLAELCDADPAQTAAWLDELTGHGLLTAPHPGSAPLRPTAFGPVPAAGPATGPAAEPDRAPTADRPTTDDPWPRFAHPLLADAVLAGQPRHRRAEVHLAAAESMHRRGACDELVAGHLLLTPAPGPRWAADLLRAAARAAERAGRPADAVALLRRALDEPLGDRRRGLLLTDLGSLEVTLGPAERTTGVRRLAEAVHLRQSDEDVFRAANTLGAVLAARGDTTAALEVLEELTERFADREDLVQAVQAAAALIASHDGHSWLQVVEGLQRIAARTPHRLAPAAHALLTEFDSTSGVLSAAEVAVRVDELVQARVEPLCRSYVLASAATLAQWADRLPVADELVTRGLANHRGPSLDPGYQCLLSVRAESHTMRGEYQALLEELGLTEPGAPEPAAPDAPGSRSWWHGIPADARPARGRYAELLGQQNAHLVAQAVIALVETGRLWQAHGLARTVAADRETGSWEWNEFLYARGLLHLATGDPAAALADLVECGRRQTERHVLSPIVTPWRTAAADCHLLLGEPGPAVALAEEELWYARIWGTPRTVGRALRTLGAATGGRRGLETAAEAVDLLRGADLDVELVPALIGLGRLLGDNGRRSAARQALREAAARAEHLGALRGRALAVEGLRATGARQTKGEHTGTDALTDSELRICRLAVAGHSNGEIAGLLHLAVRTVETHLTHSFRKLGVRRRAELGGVLDG